MNDTTLREVMDTISSMIDDEYETDEPDRYSAARLILANINIQKAIVARDLRRFKMKPPKKVAKWLRDV